MVKEEENQQCKMAMEELEVGTGKVVPKKNRLLWIRRVTEDHEVMKLWKVPEARGGKDCGV